MSTPDLVSRERQGGAASILCPVLCSGYHPASHHSIPTAAHPQATPLVWHQGDNPQLTAWAFCPLCLARLCSAFASPHTCPTAPGPPCCVCPSLYTGSDLVFPSWVGDGTKSGSTWALQSWILPDSLWPGVNPSPAAAPALTPSGSGSPERVQ